MFGLIGTISEIEETGTGDDGRRYRVKLKPTQMIPGRNPVPAWLKDQSISVDRTVADRRELGSIGETIVLPGVESARWLSPLIIAPSELRDGFPESLDLTLTWWKDEAPPACSLIACGRRATARWERDGDGFRASVPTAEFARLTPPFAIQAECGEARAACRVVPSGAASVVEHTEVAGNLMTLDNRWYRVDLTMTSHAGGAASLYEHARGLDHFQGPADWITPALEFGGQYDRFGYGRDWSDDIKKVGVSSIGRRHERGTITVVTDSLADEDKNLRAPADFTLYDDLPLLLTERRFVRGKAKEEKDKEKDVEPKEPIDSAESFKYGMRSASLTERGASRLRATDGQRLLTVRPGPMFDMSSHIDHQLVDGWMLMEHPRRRSYLLYLFDTQQPPIGTLWNGRYEMSAEAIWIFTLLSPGKTVAYSTAVAAGETGGATAGGAWIGCRDRDGKTVGVIARLRDSREPVASVSLGGLTRDVPLQKRRLPGIGEIFAATVEFEPAGVTDELSVTVDNSGGI